MASVAQNSASRFVDIWAQEVRELVSGVRRLREQYERDLWASERLEEWSPTDLDVSERYAKLWAAQHHLVWAAHQLERWVRRLARERDEPVPEIDPLLADLRNALEHLDEAVLDDADTATAGDDLNANRSLRRLPGGQLHFGSTGGVLLFELVDPAEIERHAQEVVTTADRLMQEAADWVAEFGWPDDPPDEP